MKHFTAIGVCMLALFFYAAPVWGGVFAATLKFDPTTISTNADETFKLDVVVDAENKQILGVDALIEFNADILEVESITDGDFLEIGIKEFTQPGKIYIAGVVSSPGESVTGEGVLATVQFRAKTGGSATITYTCEPDETNESNISEKSTDAPDLIVCASNGEAVITVGPSVKKPTATPSARTPTELPRSGIMEDFMLYGALGIALFIVGVGAKALLKL